MHVTDHDPPQHSATRADETLSEIREKRQRIADLLGGLLARKWLAEHTSDTASRGTVRHAARFGRIVCSLPSRMIPSSMTRVYLNVLAPRLTCHTQQVPLCNACVVWDASQERNCCERLCPGGQSVTGIAVNRDRAGAGSPPAAGPAATTSTSHLAVEIPCYERRSS